MDKLPDNVRRRVLTAEEPYQYAAREIALKFLERCPESVLETNQLSAHFHEHERADTK